jgi:DNA-binding transcriptional MerR regulator
LGRGERGKYKTYSIKEISRLTNLSAHVLRYYEKEGLLTDIKRSETGIRRYSEDNLESLRMVCCLKNTGMSIKQMRDFMNLELQGDKTLKQRIESLYKHKSEVEKKINEMNLHLEKVSHKIEVFTREYDEHIKKTASL